MTSKDDIKGLVSLSSLVHGTNKQEDKVKRHNSLKWASKEYVNLT